MACVLVPSLLLLAVSCAPVRSDADDSGLPGQQLQTSLFSVIENGSWTEYDQAVLVLVDTSLGCSDLGWNGTLDWWGLAEDVAWLNLSLLKGKNVESWATEFISYTAWSQDQNWDYSNAAYFSGQMGIGGDTSQPSPVGRDVTSNIGTEADQEEDTLTFNSVTETTATGYLQSIEGDFAAYATHCGITYNGDDDDVGFDGENDPGEDVVDDDD